MGEGDEGEIGRLYLFPLGPGPANESAVIGKDLKGYQGQIPVLGSIFVPLFIIGYRSKPVFQSLPEMICHNDLS